MGTRLDRRDARDKTFDCFGQKALGLDDRQEFGLSTEKERHKNLIREFRRRFDTAKRILRMPSCVFSP